MICRPCGPYAFCSSINRGVRILHGAHHVAQKFRSTTFPWYSERLRLFPVRDSKVNSGAGLESLRPSVDSGIVRFFGSDGAPCAHPGKEMLNKTMLTIEHRVDSVRWALFILLPAQNVAA